MNKLKISKKIPLLFLVLFLLTFVSCTTTRIGIKLLLNDFDGNALIRSEPQVKDTLQTILLAPEEYSMTAYTRRVFTAELKRTPSRYHSFYVISGNEEELYTLSFNGTKKRTSSEGAWAINTERDMEAYINFRNGTNEWEVQEIIVNNGIDTAPTLKNVIYRIDNTKIINYYYNDHRHNKENMENCNTALKNTLVEKNTGVL